MHYSKSYRVLNRLTTNTVKSPRDSKGFYLTPHSSNATVRHGNLNIFQVPHRWGISAREVSQEWKYYSRKKSQGSNSGDSGNTGDGGKIVGGAIGARGDGIVSSSLVVLYACMTFIYGSSLKRYSFDELKELFEITLKNVNTFVPMETEDRGRASELAAGSSQATIIDSTEVGSSKRDAEEELDHEGSKRQKTNEDSGSVQEQPE
ncbi:hypothetical protein Tco_0390133 [Tanacetum coccineum]